MADKLYILVSGEDIKVTRKGTYADRLALRKDNVRVFVADLDLFKIQHVLAPEPAFGVTDGEPWP